MIFTKSPNVAQYKKANWQDSFIKIVPNSTIESAKKIAEADSEIDFFFLARQGMFLETLSNKPQYNNGRFRSGDAVFFKGKPWWGSAPQCDGYIKEKPQKVRKNQKNLTPTEWDDFISAINSLMAAPSSDTLPNYQQFVQCHVDAMTRHREWGAHGGLNFLTWHRDYLWHLEERLRSFKPNVTLPYWDWINDRAIPSQLSNSSDLTKWGVTRNSNPNFSNLASPSDLAIVLEGTSFSTFTRTIENGGYHNTLHVDVGGTMVTAASPADPIFWLHHCFVDEIFANWQAKHPTVNHPNMGEQLEVAPFLTRTNGQVWKLSDLGYTYS